MKKKSAENKTQVKQNSCIPFKTALSLQVSTPNVTSSGCLGLTASSLRG